MATLNALAPKSPRRKSSHVAIDMSGLVTNKNKCGSLSDGSESRGSRTPSGLLENTYRLHPDGREMFQNENARQLMLQVLRDKLKDVKYDPETCGALSRMLSGEILERIKTCHWKRYKLVVLVSLGQNEKRDMKLVSRCVWNADIDTNVCVNYKNASLFAVACCYAVYFE